MKSIWKMTLKLTVLIIVSKAFLPPGCSAQNFAFMNTFAKNGNIQSNLIKQFPTGYWKSTNSLATLFDIASDGTNNFYAVTSPLVINTFIPQADRVYTLLNAYSPGTGAVATIEFIGDGGADQTNTFNGGVDLRDFYQGAFINTINGTTTQNAFTVSNVRGAGGTGDVNTGLVGNYVIDEQAITLNPAFHNQNLIQIKLSGKGNGTPILLGMTVTITNNPLIFVRPSAPGQFSFHFKTATNQSYTVQHCDNLAAPNWINDTNFIGTGSLGQPVLLTSNAPQRFYRVLEP
jgi:hypothetical protein